jgi:hypothetical protein
MSLLWDGNGFQYTPRDAFARKKFVGRIQNVAWQAGNLREEKGFFTTGGPPSCYEVTYISAEQMPKQIRVELG